MTLSDWFGQETYASPRTYKCGYCGLNVAAQTGYGRHNRSARIMQLIREGHTVKGSLNDDILIQLIALCPKCAKPTFWFEDKQIPGTTFGDDVNHVPHDINALYREARNCMAVDAFTSGAMACRKILMNLAVSQGAKEGQSFKHYVDYLADKGYVPPNGRDWVNHIREKGNEANHEIESTSKEDLTDLLVFTQSLLQFIFEFPNRVPKKVT